MTMFDDLRAPFEADRISWRIGATNPEKSRGLAMPYINARDVAERLDTACGPDRWQNRYPHANGKTVCEIGILCDTGNGFEWIWKSDGAGDTDFEADKGALSGAFKRAAARWGIGAYLYNIENVWVAIKAKGKSFTIEPGEFDKLAKLGGGEVEAPTKVVVNPPISGEAKTQLASALILTLRKQQTKGTLEVWGKSDKVKAEIASLDDANAARVRAEYARRLRAFSATRPDAPGGHSIHAPL